MNEEEVWLQMKMGGRRTKDNISWAPLASKPINKHAILLTLLLEGPHQTDRLLKHPVNS